MGVPVATGSRQTLVNRILASRATATVVALMPVPLILVRWVLAKDNAQENRRDSWSRLRRDTETARYAAVRAATERHAADGFVLDLGCSQGILQEGLRYRRYVGVDNHHPAIDLASTKADDSTRFVVADAESYVPDEPPDAIVLNEVVYYLRRPVPAIEHHAAQLAPGGVVVISVYSRSWASRRLLEALRRRLTLLESAEVTAGHLSWTVAVYQPRTSEQSRPQCSWLSRTGRLPGSSPNLHT
ncbi:MAG TPA: class I SAM-dependent methyltransferase [Microlunatus sp.]|nr:class I SAM-dependent methyltransferase [Microlunatus sp.]